MPGPSQGTALLVLVLTCLAIQVQTDDIKIIPLPSSSKFEVPTGIVTSVNRGSNQASCRTWNGANYKTFDGKVYTYNTRCTYILAKDCLHHTFTLYRTNEPCRRGDQCGVTLSLFIGMDEVLQLKSNGSEPEITDVETGAHVAAPAIINDMIIEKVAHYTFVEGRKLGLRIRWDGYDHIEVEVDQALIGRTCGLCGRYDNDPRNDFWTMEDEVVTSVNEFASDYKTMPLTGGVCNEMSVYAAGGGCGDNAALVNEAKSFCASIEDPKQAACHQLADPSLYMTLCEEDYCNVGQTQACSSIKSYFDDCSSLGGSPVSWRKPGQCEMKCENGKRFNSCGSSCLATCDNPDALCSDTKCTEGCFCDKDHVVEGNVCIHKSQCPCKHGGTLYPTGTHYMKDCNKCTCNGGTITCDQKPCNAVCSSTGDPHYKTFDGHKYDFHGHCIYYLVYAHEYKIAAENVECGRGGAACTKSMTVQYRGNTIQLQQNKVVIVDGKQVTIPHYLASGVSITHASSLFIQVKLPNGGVVLWDGKSRAYVTLPQSEIDNTKGLCGTFNQVQNDDFTTKSGIIEPNPNIFGNEWKTDKDCKDVPDDFVVPDPCENYVDRKAVANNECGQIKGPIFSKCANFEDPNYHYDNCMYDVCACQTDLKDCMCDAFAAYAADCAQQGIVIPWRQQISMCAVQCPAGQVFKSCGSACTATCSNIANDANCVDSCIEGCACPDGLTLDSNGKCVPIDECPCVFDGRQIAAGKTLLQGTEYCTCEGGKFECRPPPQGDDPSKPFPVPDPICTGGQIYTPCKSQCRTTCDEPAGPAGCVNDPTTCKPGCQCPQGQVWDGKQCMSPFGCPCKYHGKAYTQGETIKQDCRTCTCDNQNWLCEQKLCPSTCTAIGDSHYRTFDGKEFQFHGECDYVLVQSKGTNTNKFKISVSNVPCGSSGVACTKSIDISVGDPFGSDYHQLHLVRGKPVVLSSSYPFMVREVGLFVIIDTSFGMTIHWDKGTRVYVNLQSVHSKKVEGLCGNFNGDQNDDFTSRNGGVEVQGHTFADSWKLSPNCLPSKDVPKPCEKTPQRKDWAQERCSILLSDTFSACHSAVPPTSYVHRCEYDACACDYGADCECLCTAIAAYAQECAVAGVAISWRTQKTCPIQCADCDTYTPCLSSCPMKTCDNKAVYDREFIGCDSQMCVEGCQADDCPPGQVYLNTTLPRRCVKMDECPNKECIIQGKAFRPFAVIKDESICDRCENCWCDNGKIERMTILHCNVTRTTTPMFIPPWATTLPPFLMKSTPSSVTEGTTMRRTTPPVSTVTPRSPECLRDGWTDWMSASYPSPVSGGEREDHTSLRNKYPYCRLDQIVAVECKAVGSPVLSTQDTLTTDCSIIDGFYCRDADNGGPGSCKDYEIRFNCQCQPETTPVTGETTRAFTTTPPSQSNPCDPQTPFVSSAPSTGSDFETLDTIKASLAAIGYKPCLDHQITGVKCREAATASTAALQTVDYQCTLPASFPSGNLMSCYQQENPQGCPDIEVALTCNCTVDKPDILVTFTPPVSTLSTVSVGESSSASPPTIIVPSTKPTMQPTTHPHTQPEPDSTPKPRTTPKPEGRDTATPPLSTSPFAYPPICDVTGWSSWISNTPVPAGDIETIPTLRERLSFCSYPSKIECRTRNGQVPSDQAGQFGVTCDLNRGLTCENQQQINGQSCYDYEVRLYCDCSPDGTNRPDKVTTLKPGIEITPDTPKTVSPGVQPTTTPYCPDDTTWNDCAFKCGELCEYLLKTYIVKGICTPGNPNQCIRGCKPAFDCPSPGLWMSPTTCIDKAHCSCLMPNGTEATSGEQWTDPSDSCRVCECFENSIQCSRKSFCPQDHQQEGTTPAPVRQPYLTPPRPRIPVRKDFPHPPKPCITSGWTEWMNTSSPNTFGEVESLSTLRHHYSFCDDRYIMSDQDVECVDANANNHPAHVTCSSKLGLHCENAPGQPLCEDYSVRFWCNCGDDLTKPTRKPTISPVGTTLRPDRPFAKSTRVPTIKGGDPNPDTTVSPRVTNRISTLTPNIQVTMTPPAGTNPDPEVTVSPGIVTPKDGVTKTPPTGTNPNPEITVSPGLVTPKEGVTQTPPTGTNPNPEVTVSPGIVTPKDGVTKTPPTGTNPNPEVTVSPGMVTPKDGVTKTPPTGTNPNPEITVSPGIVTPKDGVTKTPPTGTNPNPEITVSPGMVTPKDGVTKTPPTGTNPNPEITVSPGMVTPKDGVTQTPPTGTNPNPEVTVSPGMVTPKDGVTQTPPTGTNPNPEVTVSPGIATPKDGVTKTPPTGTNPNPEVTVSPGIVTPKDGVTKTPPTGTNPNPDITISPGMVTPKDGVTKTPPTGTNPNPKITVSPGVITPKDGVTKTPPTGTNPNPEITVSPGMVTPKDGVTKTPPTGTNPNPEVTVSPGIVTPKDGVTKTPPTGTNPNPDITISPGMVTPKDGVTKTPPTGTNPNPKITVSPGVITPKDGVTKTPPTGTNPNPEITVSPGMVTPKDGVTKTPPTGTNPNPEVTVSPGIVTPKDGVTKTPPTGTNPNPEVTVSPGIVTPKDGVTKTPPTGTNPNPEVTVSPGIVTPKDGVTKTPPTGTNPNPEITVSPGIVTPKDGVTKTPPTGTNPNPEVTVSPGMVTPKDGVTNTPPTGTNPNPDVTVSPGIVTPKDGVTKTPPTGTNPNPEVTVSPGMVTPKDGVTQTPPTGTNPNPEVTVSPRIVTPKDGVTKTPPTGTNPNPEVTVSPGMVTPKDGVTKTPPTGTNPNPEVTVSPGIVTPTLDSTASPSTPVKPNTVQTMTPPTVIVTGPFSTPMTPPGGCNDLLLRSNPVILSTSDGLIHSSKFQLDNSDAPVLNDAPKDIWVLIDLKSVTTVEGVVTQGNPLHSAWLDYYKVLYSQDGVHYRYVEDGLSQPRVFDGNYDQNSKQTNRFTPRSARYVKLELLKGTGAITMRFDLIGCEGPSVTTPIVNTPCMDVISDTSSVYIASSEMTGNEADRARMDLQANGWSPSVPTNPFLVIDLGQPQMITAVATRGARGHYVTQYQLFTSDDRRTWNPVTISGALLLDGNTDDTNIFMNVLNQPIISRFVKISPTDSSGKVELKAEIRGCLASLVTHTPSVAFSVSPSVRTPSRGDTVTPPTGTNPNPEITVSPGIVTPKDGQTKTPPTGTNPNPEITVSPGMVTPKDGVTKTPPTGTNPNPEVTVSPGIVTPKDGVTKTPPTGTNPNPEVTVSPGIVTPKDGVTKTPPTGTNPNPEVTVSPGIVTPKDGVTQTPPTGTNPNPEVTVSPGIVTPKDEVTKTPPTGTNPNPEVTVSPGIVTPKDGVTKTPPTGTNPNPDITISPGMVTPKDGVTQTPPTGTNPNPEVTVSPGIVTPKDGVTKTPPTGTNPNPEVTVSPGIVTPKDRVTKTPPTGTNPNPDITISPGMVTPKDGVTKTPPTGTNPNPEITVSPGMVTPKDGVTKTPPTGTNPNPDTTVSPGIKTTNELSTTPIVLPPYCNSWTEFNEDGPTSGSPPFDDGDYELISVIKKANNYCNGPNEVIEDIECLLAGGAPYQSEDQKNRICDAVTGFRCLNSDQFDPILSLFGDTNCEDYKIKLYCKCVPFIMITHTPPTGTVPNSETTVSPGMVTPKDGVTKTPPTGTNPNPEITVSPGMVTPKDGVTKTPPTGTNPNPDTTVSPGIKTTNELSTTPIVLPPYCNSWTEFNEDGPTSGSPPFDDGDYELISVIKKANNYCNGPNEVIEDIECLLAGGAPYQSEDQKNRICDAVTGFRCLNSDQFDPILSLFGDTNCEDYKIKLYCKCVPFIMITHTPPTGTVPNSETTVSPGMVTPKGEVTKTPPTGTNPNPEITVSPGMVTPKDGVTKTPPTGTNPNPEVTVSPGMVTPKDEVTKTPPTGTNPNPEITVSPGIVTPKDGVTKTPPTGTNPNPEITVSPGMVTPKGGVTKTPPTGTNPNPEITVSPGMVTPKDGVTKTPPTGTNPNPEITVSPGIVTPKDGVTETPPTGTNPNPEITVSPGMVTPKDGVTKTPPTGTNPNPEITVSPGMVTPKGEVTKTPPMGTNPNPDTTVSPGFDITTMTMCMDELTIPEANIETSSYTQTKPRVPGGLWKPVLQDSKPYIQVEVPITEPISGLSTRGEHGTGNYVSNYTIFHSLDGMNFVDLGQYLGNADSDDQVLHKFEPVLFTRYIRLLPVTSVGETALELTIHACITPFSTTASTATPAPICRDELGVSYGGSVADSQIAVSSIYDMNRESYGASQGRLNAPITKFGSGSWQPYISDKNQYIQIDLGYATQVSGVKSQGAEHGGIHVTSYKIEYSTTGQNFYPFTNAAGDVQVFKGNSDGTSIKENFFPPIKARFVRIIPNTWDGDIAMRVELIGCGPTIKPSVKQNTDVTLTPPTGTNPTSETTVSPGKVTPTGKVTMTPPTGTNPNPEITVSPGMVTPKDGVTKTPPTGTNPNPEVTVSPRIVTPKDGVTNTPPTGTNPNPEITVSPGMVTPKDGVTKTPPTGTNPNPEITVSPGIVTPKDGVTKTPPTGTNPNPEITVSPGIVTPKDGVTKTPPTGTNPNPEITVSPGIVTPKDGVTKTPPTGTNPNPEVTVSPGIVTPKDGVTKTPPTGTNPNPEVTVSPGIVTPRDGVTKTPPTGTNPNPEVTVSPGIVTPKDRVTKTPPTGTNPNPVTTVSPTIVTPKVVVTITPTPGSTPDIRKPYYCDKNSEYFNLDDPYSDGGDDESISKLKMLKDFCNKPGETVTDVTCRIATGLKADWTSDKQENVDCSIANDGIRCLNADQGIPGTFIEGECHDYEISVYCDCMNQPPTGTPKLVSTATPPMVNVPENCKEWSDWVSLSHPSPLHADDDESIPDIVSHLMTTKSMDCSMPVGINCLAEKPDGTTMPHFTSQQDVTCSEDKGLKCTAQPGEICYDYYVRLACLKDRPECRPFGDNPTTPAPTMTPFPTPVCKGVSPLKCPTTCPPGELCDGVKCVNEAECPCILGDGSYLTPGGQTRNDKCQICHCFMSQLKCRQPACPTCPPGSTPGFDDRCECNCKPLCETPGQHVCGDGLCIPPSQVCDGVRNCDNDEENCMPTPATRSTRLPTTGHTPDLFTTPSMGVCLYTHLFKVSSSGDSLPKSPDAPKLYQPNAHWLDGNCRQCSCIVNPSGPPGSYTTKCDDISCPIPSTAAETYAPRPDLAQCCAPIVKTRCEVTINGVTKYYQAGEKWSVPNDPCEEQECVDNSGTLSVTRTRQTCQTNCKAPSVYVPSHDPAMCCGSCESSACMDVNGTRYNIGEIIPDDIPCREKKCVSKAYGVDWESNDVTCIEPKIYCQKGQPEKEDGACCKQCISKCSDCSPKPVTNQALLTQTMSNPNTGEICTGTVVNLNECSGFCQSTYNMASPGSAPMVDCKCCQPMDFTELMVIFRCPSGLPLFRKVKSPTACSCAACGALVNP